MVLISSASVIDNPWNVCFSRAAEVNFFFAFYKERILTLKIKVGEYLAEVLLSRAHGRRPITLIGFSLGARVIYHCLLTMSKRDDSFGIDKNVNKKNN